MIFCFKCKFTYKFFGDIQKSALAKAEAGFVFDEPSIGLHPFDVQVLLDNGAIVIVIEHDLDVIRNADYIIDMGPGGGDAGGSIVACGTPAEIKANGDSITGRFL